MARGRHRAPEWRGEPGRGHLRDRTEKGPGWRPAKAVWANPGGWAPAMYKRLFTLFTVERSERRRNRPNDHRPGVKPGTYFVSVMAMDADGEQVGREVYPASNELRFTVTV